jgi:hypothetical protein
MPPRLRQLLESHGVELNQSVLRRMRMVLQSLDGADFARIDVSNFSIDELRAAVNAAPVIQENEIVSVWWPQDGVAVRMKRDLLVSHLEAWWYPAQDEIFVSDGLRHLLLDHEETVQWWG